MSRKTQHWDIVPTESMEEIINHAIDIYVQGYKRGYAVASKRKKVE